MYPTDKKPGKLNQTFKVQKEHQAGDTRQTGSGSVTENISLFVEHFIKKLSRTHPSYLEDTPDFLRFIEDVK